MNNDQKHIYTIAPRSNFIKMLSDYVLMLKINAEDLQKLKIFLPTRQLCNQFKKITHEVCHKNVIAVGDAVFKYSDSNAKMATKWTKITILCQLIRNFYPTKNISYIIEIANEILKILDQIVIHDATKSFVNAIDENEYMKYSPQKYELIKLIKIVSTNWNSILKQKGYVDPNEEYKIGIKRLMKGLQRTDNHVIVAGSIGSIPATAELIKFVFELKNGHIILPGLKRIVDEKNLEADNPQFFMHKLIAKIGIAQDEIVELANECDTSVKCKSVDLFECEDQIHEAKAIASIVEKSFEISIDKNSSNHTSITIISPDSVLARLIKIELKKLDTNCKNHLENFSQDTEFGMFMIMIAKFISLQTDEIGISIIKFILFRILNNCVSYTNFVGKFEFEVKTKGFKKALLSKNGIIRDSLKIVKNALSELITAYKTGDVKKVFKAHKNATMKLFSDVQKKEFDCLEQFYEILNNLPKIEISEYFDLFKIFTNDLSGITKRNVYENEVQSDFFNDFIDDSESTSKQKVKIIETMEFRLQRDDIVILCGLNESSWPPEVSGSVFITEKDREKCGLPPEDYKIGLSANNFINYVSNCFCKNNYNLDENLAISPENKNKSNNLEDFEFRDKRVFLTRSKTKDGAKTVKSRWIAYPKFLEKYGIQIIKHDIKNTYFLHNTTRHISKINMPNPPIYARPKIFYASHIQQLIDDPYTFYAKNILKLRKIRSVSNSESKGIIFHEIFKEVIFLNILDFERAKNIGKEIFAKYHLNSVIKSFWWNEFIIILELFLETEIIRGQESYTSLTECKGEMSLNTKFGTFSLKAIADRIDIFEDRAEIIDYKTGQLPSIKSVTSFTQIQLPLEAAIFEDGEFLKQSNKNITKLILWPLKSKDKKLRIIDYRNPLKYIEELIKPFYEYSAPYIAKNPKDEYFYLSRYSVDCTVFGYKKDAIQQLNEKSDIDEEITSVKNKLISTL